MRIRRVVYNPAMMWTSVLSVGLSLVLGFAEAQGDAPSESKEIYGADDRIDLFEDPDPAVRALADSVAGLFASYNAPDRADGGVDFVFDPRDGDDYWLCGDERFFDQPTAAYCTAFVVGPDLIATAGHCVSSWNLEFVRVVFGFEMIDAETPVTSVGPERVYRIVEVVAVEDTLFNDYAVLRVDRAIVSPGAAPLSLQADAIVRSGTRVGVIGHPQGLPMKIAFGEDTAVRLSFPPSSQFSANFDASGGNSGSPVFNQETGEVEGIYVSSLVNDFVDELDCFRLNALENESGVQSVQRSSTFASFVLGEPEAKPGCAAGPAGGCAPGMDCRGDALILSLSITLLGLATSKAASALILTCVSGLLDSLLRCPLCLSRYRRFSKRWATCRLRQRK
ncbi:MAG: serine protease [Candidatus Hydrogenedentes bacterium]|jgi:hypothetical protein|nr:serine protease [Candidatus Hydrogenedentota bacterium]